MSSIIEACAAKYTADEMTRLKAAVEFSKKAHEHQMRESGEPYFIHPEAVAIMLNDAGMGCDVVIAGLLHDTVEDNKDITVEEVRDKFGEDVASMVDGVTKLTQSGKVTFLSKEDRQAENFRKMFMAIAKDARVVIIKLADRLHNVRTLEYCDPKKRAIKARETLEVYAPLAHRFGMGAMKVELEDISFEHLYPDEFKKLKEAIEPQQKQRLEVLSSAKEKIVQSLNNIGVKCEISGRPKHLYSVYRKLVRQKVTLDKIYDLIAIRIIVDTVGDCYAAMGVVHSMWRPLPGRFKDYIATPKTNRYMSLHTTVFGEDGIPFEVQIRTHEMHRSAEYGIAAHWMYKEGRNVPNEFDEKLRWLREALEYEDLSESTKEFVDNVRKDFFAEFVFVFTPNGEIIDLPAGSTPLDFAYKIHTNVGNHTQHAKVNGSIAKLDYKLKNHDVVEIMTSQQASPNLDWLKFVKTQRAKAKIRNWFKIENREENVQRGKDMIGAAAKRQGYQLPDITKPNYFDDIIQRHNYHSADDVYAAVGYGGLTTNAVLHKLIEQYNIEKKIDMPDESSDAQEHKKPAVSMDGVHVIGQPGMAIRFSACCNPVPGDNIFGYITRGRGVSIHRCDCTNSRELNSEPERIIEVTWAKEYSVKKQFEVSVVIEAEERIGLMHSISTAFLDMNISIQKLNVKPAEQGGNVRIFLAFNINELMQLDLILKELVKIESVKSAARAFSV